MVRSTEVFTTPKDASLISRNAAALFTRITHAPIPDSGNSVFARAVVYVSGKPCHLRVQARVWLPVEGVYPCTITVQPDSSQESVMAPYIQAVDRIASDKLIREPGGGSTRVIEGHYVITSGSPGYVGLCLKGALTHPDGVVLRPPPTLVGYEFSVLEVG